MKKQFKTMTAFFVMVGLALGLGSSLRKTSAPVEVKAAPVQIVLTAAKMGMTTSYTNITATIDGVVFASSDILSSTDSNYKDSMQFKANTGKIGNTAAVPGTLTRVFFSQTGTARPFTLNGGTSATSLTSEGSQTSANMSWDLTGKDYTFFSITRGANAAYVPEITVEYEPTPTKVLQSISVTTQPTKTNYFVGELFDEAGMVVTATFDTGDEVVVPTINKVPLQATDTQVEVSYTFSSVTKTAFVPITVTARNLTGLTINTNPTKMVYKVGQSFDPTGMVIDATYDQGPAVSGYTKYEYPTAAFTTLGNHDVVISSTENSAITVSLTVSVIDAAYGTYTLRQTTNTYNANPTLADFTVTKSDAGMDDFTMAASSDFRIGGSPATTKTMLGRSATEGGYVTFAFPANAVVTEVKLNNIQVDADKTPTLKINNGVSFTYSEGAQNIVLKPYANTITLSTVGTSRIWFYDAEFTIKSVNDAALDYGQHFLDTTGAECSALAVQTTTWNELKVAYEFADANVKDLIDAASPLETGSALEQAILRYNFIVGKYAYNDYLEKGIVGDGGSNGQARFDITNERNALLILGAMGLVTILGTYFLKRKKAQ